jgi:hypothetical protein
MTQLMRETGPPIFGLLEMFSSLASPPIFPYGTEFTPPNWEAIKCELDHALAPISSESCDLKSVIQGSIGEPGVPPNRRVVQKCFGAGAMDNAGKFGFIEPESSELDTFHNFENPIDNQDVVRAALFTAEPHWESLSFGPRMLKSRKGILILNGHIDLEQLSITPGMPFAGHGSALLLAQLLIGMIAGVRVSSWLDRSQREFCIRKEG